MQRMVLWMEFYQLRNQIIRNKSISRRAIIIIIIIITVKTKITIRIENNQEWQQENNRKKYSIHSLYFQILDFICFFVIFYFQFSLYLFLFLLPFVFIFKSSSFILSYSLHFLLLLYTIIIENE